MKSSTRTIIALVILNLTITGPALAQFGDGPVTFTITGNSGVGGVLMKGLPGDPVSDGRGNYSSKVLYGWSGTVTPTREGYNFEPASKVYPKVSSNKDSQDYRPRALTFVISGTTGTSGVAMTGLPGNASTDQRGYYSASVPYGFTGTVKPVKKGYTFEPVNLPYSRVYADQPNGNFAPKLAMLTISGQLARGGIPIEGARISADNGGGSDTTDAQGRYSLRIPYGWSGSVYPSKQGIVFNPPSVPFSNVTTNIVNGQPEQPEDKEADPFGGIEDSRSRSRSRGSDPYSGSPWNSSGSRPRGTSSSGYKPTIRSGGRKALVIPAGEVKAEEIAETVEDMHVMSHILDERFKEKRRIQGFFTDFGDFFGRDSRNTEATYLQGFGVLFLMEVNFAFSPPPRPQAKDPTETTEAVDSTWQKARQRVLSPGASPGMDQDDSARDYDNQMVEELKTELVEALKHASNIRNIQPDEWVILTVIGGQRQFGMRFGGSPPAMGGGISTSRSSTGPGASSGRMGGMSGGGFGGGYVVSGYGGAGGTMAGGMGAGGFGGGVYGGMSAYGRTTSSSSTVLTIRTKKSDVDDFAMGELDFEQFQEKVKILTY